jgi:hypothetical protein
MSSRESSHVVVIALGIGFLLSLVMAAFILGDGYLLDRGGQMDDSPSFTAATGGSATWGISPRRGRMPWPSATPVS